jgi:ketosteroid isomerase-like protein
MKTVRRLCGCALLLGAAPLSAAHGQGAEPDVRAVVRAFDQALAAQDSLAAMALLHPDATVYEAGNAETREQYRSGHLRGDIAFLREVRSETVRDRVTVSGELALYTSEYTMKGTARGREINRTGVETMVLARTNDGWKILHIHWSSR